jgi:hypothetical protein
MGRVSAMADKGIPYHHGSHRRLLWSPPVDSSSAQQGVDAIVVPTARPPAYLEEAAGLARALGCALVTLHSRKWTTADKAAQRFASDVDLIAVDVPEPDRLHLPDWQTSQMLAGTVFARRSDLSAKRNLALMLGHMLNWARVLFLDDDITKVNPDDIRKASDLLGTYDAVGFQIGGFPDHSVVCHAYRDAGGKQQSFIGGGALAVELTRSKSFFPDIYNDDWFFLLDGDKRLRPSAMTGQVVQARYDPFRTPDRARAEELGDVLAEGLFWLLDQDQPILDADRVHWARFLGKRAQFIQGVLEMVQGDNALNPHEKARRIAALKGSRGRLALITPELCQGYLRAWAADRDDWQRHLEELPTGQQLGDALTELSRRGCPALRWRVGVNVRPWPRPPASAQDSSYISEPEERGEALQTSSRLVSMTDR